MRRPRVLALLVPALLALACHGHSPTEPNSPASLAGTWQGTLLHPNFGPVQLVIDPGLTTGQLNGHPVSVGRAPDSDRYFIYYTEVGNTYCVFTLIVTDVGTERLSGFSGGRCPNTILATPFELTRAR